MSNTIDKHLSEALHAVALVEAIKGAIVVVVGFGLLSLVHRDVQQMGEALIAHFHLNPAKGYPYIFLLAISQLTDARLWMLAAAALTYSLVRFIEAYGLWRETRWAEWLAALSGVIYIPFELRELIHRVTWLTSAILLVNIAIVALATFALYRRKFRRERIQDEHF